MSGCEEAATVAGRQAEAATAAAGEIRQRGFTLFHGESLEAAKAEEKEKRKRRLARRPRAADAANAEKEIQQRGFFI